MEPKSDQKFVSANSFDLLHQRDSSENKCMWPLCRTRAETHWRQRHNPRAQTVVEMGFEFGSLTPALKTGMKTLVAHAPKAFRTSLSGHTLQCLLIVISAKQSRRLIAECTQLWVIFSAQDSQFLLICCRLTRYYQFLIPPSSPEILTFFIVLKL